MNAAPTTAELARRQCQAMSLAVRPTFFGDGYWASEEEPTPMPATEPWESRGACRHSGIDFFPPQHGNPSIVAAAKACCAGCPVLTECADFAVYRLPAKVGGIWGGLTERERYRLRIGTRRAAA